MKKIIFSLAALIVCTLLLFTACKEGPSDDPNVNTPTVNTVEYTPYNLMIWGDGMFCANFFGDTLAEFAREDGIALNMVSLVYDNLGTNLTYNLYELFNWAGKDLNGLNTAGGNGSRLNSILKNQNDTVNNFLVLLSRDRALSDKNQQFQRNILSMAELERLFKEHNPDGTFSVVVPPAYETGFKDYSRYALPTWTHEQHYEKIMGYANLTMDSLTDTAKKFDWATAQEYVRKNYADVVTFDWTDDSLRHPSAEATYFYAALSYCWIFDKSPVGMDVYGVIDQKTAVLLQGIAHQYVFGTDPSTVQRIENDVVYVYPIDARFENEEFSPEVKTLLATAKAFYDRGPIIQYDQMLVDAITRGHYRRDIAISPEFCTPQRTTYMDCSSFVYNCYYETFEYIINNSKSTEQMIEQSALYTFYWDGWSDLTDVEAIEDFLTAIKPGDIIVYRNKTDSWGHALLYAGNGMVYHSTGHKMSGGGSDYNFEGKMEKSELQGTVRYEPLSILTSVVGHHYMFEYGNRVAVLSPLTVLEGIEALEPAKLREQNLYDIISYKLTSAPEGVTVSPGSDVTFTYHLENIGSTAKTVNITETLPADLTFKSGDITSNNGEIKLSVTLDPGETKDISYTVTVSPTVVTGTTIKCEALAGGIPMNEILVFVENTLNKEQRASVAGFVKSASETATSSNDLITKVYNSLGYDYKCSNPFLTARALFKLSNDKFSFNPSGGPSREIVPVNLYGGQALNTSFDYPNRLKYPNIENFIEGDILLILPEQNLNSAKYWIYCGNGTFATIEKNKYVEISGKDTLPFVESLLGEMAFAVLRPSMSF